MESLTFESNLNADAGVVWDHAVSPAGINAELGPWLRMTFPKDREGLTGDFPLNQRLFRSWLLLFGVVPIDYDDIAMEAFEPPRRFQEHSVLLSHRVWRHERIIEAAGAGCRVIDRIEMQPRIPGTSVITRRFVRAVFTHRHRRLRLLFGESAPMPNE